jgi:alkaline phosphatase
VIPASSHQPPGARRQAPTKTVPQDHTGAEVRIAAQGPQAANLVGVLNHTDLFHIMARALGIE